MTKVYPPELKKYMDKQVAGKFEHSKLSHSLDRSSMILINSIYFYSSSIEWRQDC